MGLTFCTDSFAGSIQGWWRQGDEDCMVACSIWPTAVSCWQWAWSITSIAICIGSFVGCWRNVHEASQTADDSDNDSTNAATNAASVRLTTTKRFYTVKASLTKWVTGRTGTGKRVTSLSGLRYQPVTGGESATLVPRSRW